MCHVYIKKWVNPGSIEDFFVCFQVKDGLFTVACVCVSAFAMTVFELVVCVSLLCVCVSALNHSPPVCHGTIVYRFSKRSSCTKRRVFNAVTANESVLLLTTLLDQTSLY